MPTIAWIGPYRIQINTRDHGPPHVHCVSTDGTVLIAILNGAVIRVSNVHSRDVRMLQEHVAKYRALYLERWGAIHG